MTYRELLLVFIVENCFWQPFFQLDTKADIDLKWSNWFLSKTSLDELYAVCTLPFALAI